MKFFSSDPASVEHGETTGIALALLFLEKDSELPIAFLTTHTLHEDSEITQEIRSLQAKGYDWQCDIFEFLETLSKQFNFDYEK